MCHTPFYGHNNGSLSGATTVSIVLNTIAAKWTATMQANCDSTTAVYPYATDQTITAVGLGDVGVTTGANVCNFDLSSAYAVPEPASLGVLALGGLGLLLIKRRRKA